ncbi:sensor histidine kinase [Virgibacillus sp. W0181]|uniref:sensor histidine kinase n=1 Tax=Virgibacillus sp. W0181 TaxID=3391581 RepID=UPI003F482A91
MKCTKQVFLWVSFVVIVGLGIYYWDALNNEGLVKDGEVNISETDFANNGVIKLNGEWEFYWGKLLTSEDLEGLDTTVPYINVPGSWIRDLDGNRYANKGFATYRMVINDIPENQFFGMKKSNIRNASKIFVNGELVLEDGQVTRTLEKSIPGNNSEMVYFEMNESTAEIIIQASNHEYIVGGISKPILFGSQREMIKGQQQSIIFEFAMIFIVFMVGVFYTILFITSKYYRIKEPATFALAFACLCFGIMGSIYSERIITIIIPEITLSSTFRFGHIVNALSGIFVLMVVNKINAKFLPNQVRNIIAIIFGFLILFALSLPLEIYLGTLTFYMIFGVCAFFSMWLRIFWLYLNKKHAVNSSVEHITLVIAMFCVFQFWFDVTIYSFGLTSNMDVAFFCMAVFSIAIASLLIHRYTLYYKKSAELSYELLETLNIVSEKSSQVDEKELAFLQAQIKPHFLFNALNVIASLVLTNRDKAYELVLSLSDYLRAKFDFYNKEQWISVHEELDFIYAYLKIEKARFEDRLKVIASIEDGVDFVVPPFIIQPIVENAVRHGINMKKEGGTVTITIEKTAEGHNISVSDDGIGISEEKLQNILHSNRSNGDGIGLHNIQKRMKRLFGYGLSIESVQGKGTTISLNIPDRGGVDNEISLTR